MSLLIGMIVGTKKPPEMMKTSGLMMKTKADIVSGYNIRLPEMRSIRKERSTIIANLRHRGRPVSLTGFASQS